MWKHARPEQLNVIYPLPWTFVQNSSHVQTVKENILFGLDEIPASIAVFYDSHIKKLFKPCSQRNDKAQWIKDEQDFWKA